MDNTTVARAYYDAIDTGDYEALAALLTDTFVQIRPDRTLKGRDRFVRFMRDERPITETEHDITAVYTGQNGVAVQGTVVTETRSLFEFIDTFCIETDRITRLTTFTR